MAAQKCSIDHRCFLNNPSSAGPKKTARKIGRLNAINI